VDQVYFFAKILLEAVLNVLQLISFSGPVMPVRTLTLLTLKGGKNSSTTVHATCTRTTRVLCSTCLHTIYMSYGVPDPSHKSTCTCTAKNENVKIHKPCIF